MRLCKHGQFLQRYSHRYDVDFYSLRHIVLCMHSLNNLPTYLTLSQGCEKVVTVSKQAYHSGMQQCCDNVATMLRTTL